MIQRAQVEVYMALPKSTRLMTPCIRPCCFGYASLVSTPWKRFCLMDNVSILFGYGIHPNSGEKKRKRSSDPLYNFSLQCCTVFIGQTLDSSISPGAIWA